MMAGIAAGQLGKRVLLLEKNEKLGKKLFITGKGRCNVTSNKDLEEIIANIKGNPYFMYSSLYTFTNEMLKELLTENGVQLKVERGDRVFPESDKSSDILRCFEQLLKKNQVEVRLTTSVSELLVEDSCVCGVKLSTGAVIRCSSVILACGGLSYPLTGSTGDGYRMAEKAGHHIVTLRPSLVPLVVKEEWISDIMGLSLKNVALSVYRGSKIVYRDFGEMLFTHFGLSGPIVLSASRDVVDQLPGEVKVVIDLKPALSMAELDKRLLRDFEKYTNKQFKNALGELLPQKLIKTVIAQSGIDPEKPVNIITREERLRLLQLLKEFTVTVIGTRSIQEAIITRGGVDVREIDPSTMESKLVKGLYIIGETLDVDGVTGGFNLQIAFSTGYVAGLSC